MTVVLEIFFLVIFAECVSVLLCSLANNLYFMNKCCKYMTVCINVANNL